MGLQGGQRITAEVPCDGALQVEQVRASTWEKHMHSRRSAMGPGSGPPARFYTSKASLGGGTV